MPHWQETEPQKPFKKVGWVRSSIWVITNERIQTGMGKIEGGTFGSSIAVSGFDIL